MMRIAHHHCNGFPPFELLHDVEIHPGLHESGRPGVLQVMKTEFVDLGLDVPLGTNP